jgi:sulfur-oxidizing protein SoxY
LGLISAQNAVFVPTPQVLTDLARRRVLKICGVGMVWAVSPAFAQFSSHVRNIVGDAKLIENALTLAMPQVAETGASVALAMALKGEDVSRWVVIADKNPRPIVLDARVGALVASSSFVTRVRLGATQRVVALARTRAGAWHVAGADVALTGSACYDGT